jgi:hypothetical protein
MEGKGGPVLNYTKNKAFGMLANATGFAVLERLGESFVPWALSTISIATLGIRGSVARVESQHNNSAAGGFQNV